jgi:ComF family protein
MLKDFILLYKYRGCQILGKDLARFMLNSLGRVEEIWWGLDALVPVPLHPKRKRQRGFNQALLLARELAREKEIQLLKKSLVKIKNRPPQTLVQSQERGKNIKGAFGVNNEEKIKDKVVLLVDDVFTTGATITECSVTLIEAGAREVRAVTVAQA